MAEFPDLGQQCSLHGCKQLDFLPFVCTDCGKIFCSEHKFPENHECDKSEIVDSRPDYKGTKSYPCFAPDCEARELMPVICSMCGNCFCLRHRHPQDHQCKSLIITEKSTKVAVPTLQPPATAKTVQHKPGRKRRGGKSSKTAAKVALMKMKMHAIGDKGIPDNERVFLQVFLPVGSVEKNKSLFFSKVWTSGRVIDTISNRAGLKNTNNTGSEKKLRLFSWEDGNLLQVDKTLEDFLSTETVINGGNVILEYVNSDCQFLDNLDDYMVS